MDTREDAMEPRATGPRAGGLLAWQWAHYPEGHRDRKNLLLHVLSAPAFMLGTVGLVLAPWHPWSALGVLGLVFAVAVQGRGHKREAARPLPFRGPLDVAARLFVEQWVTFPRFVLSGRFAAAWRAARR
jgi:hypothetical protein